MGDNQRGQQEMDEGNKERNEKRWKKGSNRI